MIEKICTVILGGFVATIAFIAALAVSPYMAFGMGIVFLLSIARSFKHNS